MIDLNRFKLVNDTLGHAAGDQVLKEMAAKIQECLRQGDALGRLGGDEFLVVLPGADLDALQAVYRRISDLACQAGEGAAAVTVTAACGGVTVPAGSSAELAAVLAQADNLLYQVKRAGRQGFGAGGLRSRKDGDGGAGSADMKPVPDMNNGKPQPQAAGAGKENSLLDRLRASALALVVANLMPLAGVLALNWNVTPIMVFYWTENLVIGFYNVLKMRRAQGSVDGRTPP